MAEMLLDLLENGVRAGLLLFLCKNNIALKEKYRSTGKVLFFLQVFGVNYWLAHSMIVDRFVYGNTSGEMNNSSYSIIKLAFNMLCTFLMMHWLYQGRRIAKSYLVLVFYMVQEMARFMIHSVWSLVTNRYLNHLTEQVVAETISPEQFYIHVQFIQLYGYFAFAAGNLFLMYVVILVYRKYSAEPVEELSRQGLWFLMLTPIIGMVFDVSWRISFFSRKGEELEFLYDRHGSMYVVVPTIAALCLVCTVFSRKIYSELMKSESQKNSLLFYKQQLTQMTAHVKELEQLYDGIRGMRHDISNYVSDMEHLLGVDGSGGQVSEQIRMAAGKYLRNMQQAADNLTLRFSTGNPVTDVILNRKGQICLQESITMEGDLLYPESLGIEAFDMGILLNNALDNAIESCRKEPEEYDRFIRFRGYVKGRMFFLVIENTCNGTGIQTDGGKLRTTKADREVHGLGMSNMQKCVEKYYGTMQYEIRDKMFVLTIMLQGVTENI